MTFDKAMDRYQTNMKQMLMQGDKLEKFVVHSEAVGKKEGYIPFTDFLGPMLWFPHHCAPIEQSKCISPARDLVCEAKELTDSKECEAQLDGKGNNCQFKSSEDSELVRAKVFQSPIIAYLKQPNNKV